MPASSVFCHGAGQKQGMSANGLWFRMIVLRKTCSDSACN